jgi:hypothetical protein
VNQLTGMKEPELKTLFFKTMIADFHIATEVTGKHLLENKTVRADFVIRPKPHLIKAAFDDVYIAVEVKSPNGGSLFKASETMWQAASYGQSIYWNKVRPGFAIVFPDLDAFHIGELEKLNGTQNPTAGRILSHIGQFMNVGFLSLDKYVVNGWNIKIGGISYYSKRYGKSAMKLINRYVGNKAS